MRERHHSSEIERRYADMRATAQKRYPDVDGLSLELFFYLFHSVNRIQARIAEISQAFDLTLPGFNVLGLLSHGPREGMPLNELSRFLLVSRANVTGLIDSLARKGLVKRAHHETDRRVRLARITKKGEMVLESYRPHHFKKAREIAGTLTVDEKKTLVRILSKWNAGLGSPQEE